MDEPVRRWSPPQNRLSYELSERWVRGIKGGVTVVDSRRPVLVWEPKLPVPFYAFPVADVLPGVLRPAASPPPPGSRAGARFYDLVVDSVVTSNAAWTYPGQYFAETVAFAWKEWSGHGMDHWFEEDEEIFVHPRDPYGRVDAIRSSRYVQVAVAGCVIADSRRPVLVFETGLPVRYYLPRADVDMRQLVPSQRRTRCPFKGVATYWTFDGGPVLADVAWTYRDPLVAVRAIADHIAFYNEQVEITVDGDKVV